MPEDRPLSLAAVAVIRRRMDAQGVSGNRLAQLTGMSQTSLAYNLRGQGFLSLDDLERISDALGMGLPSLVHESLVERAANR